MPVRAGRPFVVVAAIVVVIALCGGCTTQITGRPRNKQAPSPSPSPHALSKLWTSEGFTAVTAPEIAAGVVLVYGTIEDQLYLFGLNASTGKILWKQAASTSDVTRGIGLQVKVIDDKAVYFRPDAKDITIAQVVIADPVSGRDLGVTRALPWVSVPIKCDDKPGGSLCSSAYRYGQLKSYRIDPTTGALQSVGGTSGGYRDLGGGVVDLLVREPEYFGHLNAGSLAWKKPTAEVFGAGFSTDVGWNFDSYKEDTITVGTLDKVTAPLKAKAWDQALATDMNTVGLETATGKILWSEPGTSLGCIFHLDSSEDGAGPVRCRYTGAAHYVRSDAGLTVTFTGLTVTVERFDPATGKALWSLPLGDEPALAKYEDYPPELTSTQVLLDRVGGPVVLDLLKGVISAVRPGAIFWCGVGSDFTQSSLSDPDEKGPSIRHGAGVVNTCTAAGSLTSDAPFQVPKNEGVQFAELTLVTTRDGVVAYR